jgi:hypothetical protein
MTMKTTLCTVFFVAVALVIAQSSPSSAALLTPGAPVQTAAGSDGIALATYASRHGERFYGQRRWWAYRYHPGKLRVYRSRLVYGCGHYNCYDGKSGFRNRLPITMGVYPYWRCCKVYSYPRNLEPDWYPDFGVVVH